MKITALANRPQPLVLADGTIEGLKWLALFLMTLDHINKYIFDESLPALFELGRVAMPLFAFVLAYNLARPDALSSGSYQRSMKRLGIFGVAASPFFMGLGSLALGLWPLNIMFTLLLSTWTLYLLQLGGASRIWLALASALIGGFFVEFWWFALAFFGCAFCYCKTPNKTTLFGLCLSCALLFIVNRNFWALASIPIILLAPLVKVQIPRIRNIFYSYYPAHLAVLLLIVNIKGK